MGRNTIAKKSVIILDGQPSGVSFTFADGKALEVTCDDLPENVIRLATCHGLSQKIGDSYSKTTGPTDARQKAEATIKGLIDGDWNIRADVTTDLALALSRLIDQPLGVCQAKLDKTHADYIGQAKVEAVKASKHVKLELLRIKLERAEASSSEADDLDF